MVLVYVLFALTVSAILTALFSGTISQHGQGHAFMYFFALLLLLAGAVGVWLAPAIASGQRSGVYPAVLLAVFAAILALSTILSVRSRSALMPAAAERVASLETEAEVFGSLVWLALMISGITILKNFVI